MGSVCLNALTWNCAYIDCNVESFPYLKGHDCNPGVVYRQSAKPCGIKAVSF